MKALMKLLFLFILFSPVVYAGHYATFTSSEDVTRGELSLEVEGESAEILDFFKVDAAGTEAVFLNHPAGRRQFVLVFDLIFSTPEQLLVARAEAGNVIKATTKDDLIMIAGIGSNGLRVVCAPTADRNQIVSGLNALGREKLEGMIVGPEGNFYSAKFSPKTPPLELTPDEDFLKNLKPLSAADKKKEEYSFLMVQGLVDLSYTLAALHGRKAVLFFSPGFETKGVSLNLDLDQKRGMAGGSPSTGSNAASLDTITSSTRDIEALAQQGPGARPRETGPDVIPVLYAGVDTHFYVLNPGEQDNGFLKDLAEKTGGLYAHKTFDSAQVLAAEQKFYVVEWQNLKKKEWKTLNSMKISAGDKKVHSSGKWMSPRPIDEETPLEKRMRLAEAVYKDFGNFSADDRFWIDFAFEQGFSKISSFIQIGSAGLLKSGGKDSLRLEFYGYAMTRDGAVVDANSVPVELDLGNDKLRERLSQSGLKVWNVLLGNEEPMLIRSIVINAKTGETMTATLLMDVNESGLTMSSPFVPATNFTWIVWPKPMDEFTRRGTDIRYPYMRGEDYLVPDLSPVIKPGAGVVYFRLYNLLPESRNPAVHFQLLNSKGQATEIDTIHLMQKPDVLEHSGMELFWDLKTIPVVEPGPYRMKIGIQDPLRKQTVFREIKYLSIQSS